MTIVGKTPEDDLAAAPRPSALRASSPRLRPGLWPAKIPRIRACDHPPRPTALPSMNGTCRRAGRKKLCCGTCSPTLSFHLFYYFLSPSSRPPPALYTTAFIFRCFYILVAHTYIFLAPGHILYFSPRYLNFFLQSWIEYSTFQKPFLDPVTLRSSPRPLCVAYNAY